MKTNNLRHGFLGYVAGGVLAAMMAGTQKAVPSFARSTPRFELMKKGPNYDGLGRKTARVQHPNHQRRARITREWLRARVTATHSFNPDPRPDKYLHSHARIRRRQAASG